MSGRPAFGPPPTARRMLAALLPEPLRAALLGDLEEEFRTRAAGGRGRARRWYWRQVLRSIPAAVAARLRALDLRRRLRALGRSHSMDSILQDLRFSLRSLLRSPAFVVVALTTLALAIGVNTAIYSLADVILLSELPVGEPDSFAFLYGTQPERGETRAQLTLPDFADLRERTATFADLAALRSDVFVLTGQQEPIRVNAFRTTANFFEVWGVEVGVGRGFAPREDDPGAADVAVLGHGFWQRRFAADPGIVGQSLRLDGAEFQVIGVMPQRMEFGSLAEIDVWVPLRADPALASRDRRDVLVTGRLRPGATIEQAQQEMTALMAGLASEHPATNAGWTIDVVSTYEQLGEGNTYTILLLLGLTVGFVLLIACANIANMLLARGTVREKELAVRAALGAGRGRLLRQLLIENLLLSIVAAGLGLLVARVLLRGLAVMTTSSNSTFFRMTEVNESVLLFTVGVSLVAPLMFGLWPSIRASRAQLHESLKEGGRTAGSGRGKMRLRGVLVGLQVGMAVVLMVVAGLTVRTVYNLSIFEPGFAIDGLLSMRLELPESKYETDARVRGFFGEVLTRVEGLSGVEGAALTSARPLADLPPGVTFRVAARPDPDPSQLPRALRYVVTVDYFEVAGIPLLRGRSFGRGDGAGASPVMIVNATAARRYWANEEPVGQLVRLGTGDPVELLIVGVVGDVMHPDIDDFAVPQIYLPFDQAPSTDMGLVVRAATADPTDLAGAVREVVWEVDPDQPIGDVRTLRQVHYDELSASYAIVVLFAAFGGFALLMASAGIYGVMSYAVGERTREIGVRMALGATRSGVGWMVVRQGARAIVIGGAIGLLGALLVSRALASLVFGISPTDPFTFAAVTLSLAAVALVANWLPVRRATRVDPVLALRSE